METPPFRNVHGPGWMLPPHSVEVVFVTIDGREIAGYTSFLSCGPPGTRCTVMFVEPKPQSWREAERVYLPAEVEKWRYQFMETQKRVEG